MRRKLALISLLILLVLATAVALLVNECDYGGGMGARFKECACSGVEVELYDRSASDGPTKSVCIGIVDSTTCYMYKDGPREACEGE